MINFKVYFIQRKIFVDKDTSSAKGADCCIKTLVTVSLTILPTNVCTNEISKLLDSMENLHSQEISQQNTDFVPLEV